GARGRAPAPAAAGLDPGRHSLRARAGQEGAAPGQLFAALRAAGARRGARRRGPGRARAGDRTQRGHRQSAGVPGCAGRAAGPAGDFRRAFPRHAAGAGDELRQGGDPGAGLHQRAPAQKAGRPGHQRRPARFPGRQRGRHRVGIHDRAVHGGRDRQRPGQPRDAGIGVLHPDLGQRRGPCVDGCQRGAPRAGHGRRPGQGTGAGTDDRRAGAGPAPAPGRRRRAAGQGGGRRPRRHPRAHRLPRARPRAGRRRARGGRDGRRRQHPGGRTGGDLMRVLAAWLCLLLAAPAVAGTMSGTVFEDANANGMRDAGEHGIAGIKVSNGRDIVSSGADGNYEIATKAGDIVFAIKPADRGFGRRADGLPAFWQAADSSGERFDIALSPARKATGSLEVLLFTDSQVASLVDVDDYHTDIVEPLQGTAAALGLTMGDIVDDELSLYPAINAVTTSLGVPWLHIAGNHDLDAGAVDDAATLATFHRTYGPDTVAWEEAGASFIGLDDVVATPAQRPAYAGGLREDQFAFLEAYLPTVDKTGLLVVAAHIPFFQMRSADRERLFALLRDFSHVLLLSGHTHQQMHVFHDADAGWHGDRPLHEYNVGAACGAFWSGVEDAAGVPDATMADGTPNGHARLRVQAG